MDDKTPLPNEPTPLQEVGDTLRPAVEQVRAVVPPPDAVERSVDHAQRLGPPRRRSRRWLATSAVAAGIAVVIFVGFRLWPGQFEKRSEPAAWNQREALGPVATEERIRNTEPNAPHKDRSVGRLVESDAKKKETVHLSERPQLKADDNLGYDKADKGPMDPIQTAGEPPISSPKANSPYPARPGAEGGLGGRGPDAPPAKDAKPEQKFSHTSEFSGRNGSTSGRDKDKESEALGRGDGVAGKKGVTDTGRSLPESEQAKNLDELKNIVRQQELVLNKTKKLRLLARNAAID